MGSEPLLSLYFGLTPLSSAWEGGILPPHLGPPAQLLKPLRGEPAGTLLLNYNPDRRGFGRGGQRSRLPCPPTLERCGAPLPSMNEPLGRCPTTQRGSPSAAHHRAIRTGSPQIKLASQITIPPSSKRMNPWPGEGLRLCSLYFSAASPASHCFKISRAFRAARARWLTWFFMAGGSSAIVFPSSGM